MKSPFPGMDPYIEVCGLWEDFHEDLIGEIKRALAAVVPERYLVRTGERSYVVLVEENGKASHPFIPDVRITGPAEQPSTSTEPLTTAVVTEADEVTLRAFLDDRHKESFVEIFEMDPELRLVTSIEVLSPSNKRRGTEGWEVYLRKRQALMLGAANLVEIDLLRRGNKMPMLDPWPKSPYTLLVCRQSRAPYCQVRAGHFQRPLPTVKIPLARPDPDIPLALQPMIEAIYARSRYHRSIDYSKPLSPPFTIEEQNWLGEQLRIRTQSS